MQDCSKQLLNDVIFIRFIDEQAIHISYTEKFTDCKHLVQQRIMTSQQNAVSHRSMVRDGVLKSGYTSVIFVDMGGLGAKVDGTCYCNLLLSQQLLPVICRVSNEFVF